jgi:hypothetical protein
MWQDYLNALLGLCVLVVAFMSLTGVTLTWTLAILGAAIAILAFWSATMAGSTTKHA